MQAKRLLSMASLLVVVLLAASQYGCRKHVRIETRACTSPSGEPAICVVVVVDFSSASSVNASTLYQTREVDPNLLMHEPNATPNGTVEITLDTGAVVRHSGTLYLDSGTNPAPHTAGYDVLTYRPSDPGSLQAFIDTYQARASSAKVTVEVMLRDISSGNTSTTIDARGNHASTLEYLASAGTSLEGPIEENKDF